jgi:hypothetical protein
MGEAEQSESQTVVKTSYAEKAIGADGARTDEDVE